MKRFKKMMAIAIVAVMTMTMSASFAFAVDDEPGEFTNPTGAFSGTPEYSITATNVVAGDSVDYYQLVAWDATTSNWKLTSLGEACGITLAELENGITEEEAGTIADTLASADKTGSLTGSGTTFTAGTSDNPIPPGLYYLKATPAATNKDVIYNPAFVSADYYAGRNTVDFSTTIGSSAVVKKSSIPFEKKVDNTDLKAYQDVKPGDIIPYTIETTIPSYGSSYTNPTFTISDSFSTGLQLEGNISVTYKAINPSTGALSDATTTTSVTNVVTITPTTGDAGGFSVVFDPDYLSALGQAAAVTVEYSAKVNTNAENNVNVMDNTATLTFSNKPGSTDSKEDITRHYTFSIDGNLLGGTNDQTDELIKIACDANGSPIYDSKTTYYGKSVNPLDGATFELKPVDPTTMADPNPRTATSTDGGHIQFLGLDAGTYELTETAAPQGYIKDGTTYIVEIVPHYSTATKDGDQPMLESYDVKFYEKGTSGNTLLSTSTFTTTNDGTRVTSSAHADSSQFLKNTPGAELPSTGGIGTTLFYLIGAILVIGAGVILVTRRRVNNAE